MRSKRCIFIWQTGPARSRNEGHSRVMRSHASVLLIAGRVITPRGTVRVRLPSTAVASRTPSRFGSSELEFKARRTRTRLSLLDAYLGGCSRIGEPVSAVRVPFQTSFLREVSTCAEQ